MKKALVTIRQAGQEAASRSGRGTRETAQPKNEQTAEVAAKEEFAQAMRLFQTSLALRSHEVAHDWLFYLEQIKHLNDAHVQSLPEKARDAQDEKIAQFEQSFTALHEMVGVFNSYLKAADSKADHLLNLAPGATLKAEDKEPYKFIKHKNGNPEIDTARQRVELQEITPQNLRSLTASMDEVELKLRAAQYRADAHGLDETFRNLERELRRQSAAWPVNYKQFMRLRGTPDSSADCAAKVARWYGARRPNQAARLIQSREQPQPNA